MGVLQPRVFRDGDAPFGDFGNPTKVKKDPCSCRGFPRQEMVESLELVSVTETESALINLMATSENVTIYPTSALQAFSWNRP